MKWVTGFAGNRGRGLPAISALVVLSDPAPACPIAILDGGPITAQRTAAVCGVAIAPVRADHRRARARGPCRAHRGGRPGPQPPRGPRARPAGRRAAQSTTATRIARSDWPRRRGRRPGSARCVVAETAREAVAGADVVVTAVAFTDPARRQVMTGDWLTPDALVVAVDYATMLRRGGRPRCAPCSSSTSAGSSWPTAMPASSTTTRIPHADAGRGDPRRDARRPAGRVVVTHLGVGLADVIFGDAVLRRAPD